MRFGHFDDARREYVIDTPRTPLPWINYLGSEDFFSLVSNTGGGYSFYRDARLRRLTRYRYNNSPLDMDGHRIYINDGGTIWNPGWQPAKTELDSYTCRHGLGYTILQGEKDGIAAAQELFVPRGDACEIDRLTLENKTAAPRTLDVFSYVEFCLWDAMDDSSNFQRNFSTGEVEVVESAIYHRQSTGSVGITTPCSGPTPLLPASTPAGMPSAACTAAPPHRKRSKPVTARTALPTAGLRWVPTISISRWHRVRKRASSSGWATLKTRSGKNSALPASSTKPGPRP